MRLLNAFFIVLVLSVILFGGLGCSSSQENVKQTPEPKSEVSPPAFPNVSVDSSSPPAFPSNEVNQ
jgi:hypothetical protein